MNALFRFHTGHFHMTADDAIFLQFIFL